MAIEAALGHMNFERGGMTACAAENSIRTTKWDQTPGEFSPQPDFLAITRHFQITPANFATALLNAHCPFPINGTCCPTAVQFLVVNQRQQVELPLAYTHAPFDRVAEMCIRDRSL